MTHKQAGYLAEDENGIIRGVGETEEQAMSDAREDNDTGDEDQMSAFMAELTLLPATSQLMRAARLDGNVSKRCRDDGIFDIAQKKTHNFHFIDRNGRDITGTEESLGYFFRDYFDCDLDATTDELTAAYKGPDCYGIGVRWEAAKFNALGDGGWFYTPYGGAEGPVGPFETEAEARAEAEDYDDVEELPSAEEND